MNTERNSSDDVTVKGLQGLFYLSGAATLYPNKVADMPRTVMLTPLPLPTRPLTQKIYAPRRI